MVCKFLGFDKVEKKEAIFDRMKKMLTAGVELLKINEFIFVGNGDFPKLCLKIIMKLKEKHKGIKIHFSQEEFHKDVVAVFYYENKIQLSRLDKNILLCRASSNGICLLTV